MAPTSAAALAAIPLRPTLGACLLGVYLSSVFYGLTLLQTYQYFYRYWSRDKIYIYVLVLVLTTLDTLCTVANMYSMWYYLIDNYGNRATILWVHWTVTASLMMTVVIETLVKHFYAYRLWILSGKKMWHLALVIVVFTLATLGIGTAYIILMFKNGSLLYLPKIGYLLRIGFSFSLAADILIAGSITHILLKGRGRGIMQTDGILRKLVTYTISTGVLTIICTIMVLVLGQVYRSTFYDTIFYFPLSKCYVNAMLAFLNVRDSLRGKRDTISVNLRMADSTKSNPTRDYGTPEDQSTNTCPERKGRKLTFNKTREEATIISVTTHATTHAI
ncbi:unnamed protein product [Cyclocybe aegerita]|uniref:DUF6534 domain-containing protein n=1 Tax=Cyclocybe aegerita TaxID=1973307 RepID=A0A8S0XHP1_CYCAE|nr:unnamed protein product [Cyclocybe aegerita]